MFGGGNLVCKCMVDILYSLSNQGSKGNLLLKSWKSLLIWKVLKSLPILKSLKVRKVRKSLKS